MAKEKKSKKAEKSPLLSSKERSKEVGASSTLAPSEVDYQKSRDDLTENEDTLDVVSFYLNDELFALEVEYVGAVIMSREIVGLPHTPGFIDGLISVRGEMILVMNLKKRLGIDTAATIAGNIIVTDESPVFNDIGMLVDRMAGVMEVEGKLKAPSKPSKDKKSVQSSEQNFIKGTLESVNKEELKVLDIDKLLAFNMPPGAA
ncbi:MAG: chemotaxis protein CheW [Proteobacteria bacterium]|nr:chemotaxis protein CheW [Pseudomonadota bacterium]